MNVPRVSVSTVNHGALYWAVVRPALGSLSTTREGAIAGIKKELGVDEVEEFDHVGKLEDDVSRSGAHHANKKQHNF